MKAMCIFKSRRKEVSLKYADNITNETPLGVFSNLILASII